MPLFFGQIFFLFSTEKCHSNSAGDTKSHAKIIISWTIMKHQNTSYWIPTISSFEVFSSCKISGKLQNISRALLRFFLWQVLLHFLTFPACFWIPITFSNLNCNCSNLLEMRNLQEQVKKAFCYLKLFWLFIVWTNCSSDFKSFSQSLGQFFLTVGKNNFGNKIP